MRLLFQKGKLNFRDKWNNVAEHGIVQAVAGEVVSGLIGLSEDEKTKIVKVALCHDWDKRLEIKPADFTDEEKAAALKFLETVNPDRTLIATTHPGFHNKILSGEATFLEELTWYLDDIAKGSEIALFEERIAEVESRRPDLDPAFWGRERAAGKLFEQELFEILRDRGVSIDKPEDIPLLIKAEVEKALSKSSVITFTRAQAESPGRRNEDIVMVQENDEFLVAAVVDGGSALSSITTVKGVERLSGLFVSERAADYIQREYDKASSVEELLLSTNRYIALELQSYGIDPETAGPLVLPTASGVGIVRIDKKNQTLEIAQVEEVAVLIVEEDGKVRLALPIRTPPWDVRAMSLAQQIAEEKGITLKEALRDERVGELFVKSRANENAPGGTGSGALNGRTALKEYIQSVKLPLEGIRSVILLTDGMFPPKKDFSSPPDWEEVSIVVKRDGLKGLYDWVFRLKSSDPELDKYPRAKKHDDASGVTVKLLVV